MAFQPNTTPTPNWLYNGEMKKMNETELKVVLLVTRKTLGWFDPMTGNQRKEQDYIAQKQFRDITGQKSNTSIANAIQKCVNNGWIIARDRSGNLCDTPEKRARRKVWYQLGNVFTSKISGTESKPDGNLVQKMEKSGTENVSHLVQKVDSTKETLTKETIQKEEGVSLFNDFWKEYPKKVGKVVAEKSFRRISPSKELLGVIMKDVRRRASEEDWRKEDGRFIPHPATYLNQRRWEDEVKITKEDFFKV